MNVNINVKEIIKEKNLVKDLTDDELASIVYNIYRFEYNKRPEFLAIEPYEDGAQHFFEYMYEKSAKGLKGIKEIQDYTVAHFVNLVHVEARNNINYSLRKKCFKTTVVNVDYLSTPIGDEEDNRTIEDSISDTHYIESANIEVELDNILSEIEDKEISGFDIRYGFDDAQCIFKLTYRSFAKLYFDIFCGSIVYKHSLKDIIFYRNTDEHISDKDIRSLISNFKEYIISNNILGGSLA